MRRARSLLAALLAIGLAAPAPGQGAAQDALAQAAAIRAHVAWLASDALRGREAGTPDYDAAARYVAAQFAAAGLKPGGDGGTYLQAVPLITYRVTGPGRMALDGVALAPDVDFAALPDPAEPALRIEAPVVFVGYGVTAADYTRLAVRGRIVAFLSGAPPGLSGEQRNYVGTGAVKAELAARHGAIAAIELAVPGSEARQPFARLVPLYRAPRTAWAEADGRGHRTAAIPLAAVVSEAGATRLFARARRSWPRIAATLARPGAVPRAEQLPGRLAIETATAFTPARSANVVGVIPGSDPALAGEALVLSAHLDHVGIGPPDAAGDTIYNGALDNAVGVAALIEEAKLFERASPGQPGPRRTIVFAAFTAEEKGLVGSDWFAAHPPPDRTIVANVNFDMPILTYPFTDMVAFGGERSTLGPLIERTLAALGIATTRDPIPAEGIFVRSDHFSFVRRGIPAVYLWPGPAGPGAAAIADFLAHRYHRPSDDLAQPVRWDQAARFVDANYRIARAIADADARPCWNRGDYFGTMFGGPMVGKRGD